MSLNLFCVKNPIITVEGPSKLDKFSKVYAPLLSASKAIKKEFKKQKYFLNNYQIMRNLIHIDDNSFVVFL